jgi:hypothetical protein
MERLKYCSTAWSWKWRSVWWGLSKLDYQGHRNEIHCPQWASSRHSWGWSISVGSFCLVLLESCPLGGSGPRTRLEWLDEMPAAAFESCKKDSHTKRPITERPITKWSITQCPITKGPTTKQPKALNVPGRETTHHKTSQNKNIWDDTLLILFIYLSLSIWCLLVFGKIFTPTSPARITLLTNYYWLLLQSNVGRSV